MDFDDGWNELRCDGRSGEARDEESESAPSVHASAGLQDDTQEVPVKRKRGRPTRAEQMLKLKTRESQRIRKCPKIMTLDSTKSKSVWGNEDKILLLKGLEQFGPDNIEGLQTYLPHKKENEISNQIRMWSGCAQNDLGQRLFMEQRKSNCATVNCITKLDEWIKHFDEYAEPTNSGLVALSNVFLLIAEYSDLPSPRDFNGIDLRAMYRFIHCMLNGVPYHDVNHQTARVLADCVADLLGTLRDTNTVAELQPHLYGISNQSKPSMRTYRPHPSSGITFTSKNPGTILNNGDLNPLKIPPHVLAKKEVESEDDSDDCYTVVR